MSCLRKDSLSFFSEPCDQMSTVTTLSWNPISRLTLVENGNHGNDGYENVETQSLSNDDVATSRGSASETCLPNVGDSRGRSSHNRPAHVPGLPLSSVLNSGDLEVKVTAIFEGDRTFEATKIKHAPVIHGRMSSYHCQMVKSDSARKDNRYAKKSEHDLNHRRLTIFGASEDRLSLVSDNVMECIKEHDETCGQYSVAVSSVSRSRVGDRRKDFLRVPSCPSYSSGRTTSSLSSEVRSLTSGRTDVSSLRSYETMVTQTSTTSVSTIQIIKLRRQTKDGSFGFSLRGGCEHGTGFYISQVQLGTEAEHKGLKVGDQVIRVNGFSVDRAVHQEVMTVIRSKNNLVLKVKRVGMVPVKNNRKDPLTWRMVEGNNIDYPDLYGLPCERVIETELFIDGANSSAGLGCSIANGPPEKPGIFVQTTKDGGISHAAGLRTGDQILKINGVNVEDLNFNDVVTSLKSSNQLRLIVRKGVGLDLFSPVARDVIDSNDAFIGRPNSSIRYMPSNSDDSSSHNSSERLKTGCDVSNSSVGTHSSLSDDRVCTSSDDAGSLTSSETYGPSPEMRGWNDNETIRMVKEEQEKLARQRKQLEEEQQRLKQQSEELSKEKAKLEEEKKKQQTTTSTTTTTTSTSFLSELKQKRKIIEQRGIDRASSGSSSPRAASNNHQLTDSDLEGVNDDCKRRIQHERLMDEFKKAHRKMFSKGNSDADDYSAKTTQTTSVNSTSGTNEECLTIEAKSTIPSVAIEINSAKSQSTNKIVAVSSSTKKVTIDGDVVKVSRRNVRCPAPPPPPDYNPPENIIATRSECSEKTASQPTEKRVTILPEATSITCRTNRETTNKTCTNGILKKTGQTSNEAKVTTFADTAVGSTNKSTVMVTISSYPDSNKIPKNRFVAPSIDATGYKRNLTTRVMINNDKR